MTDFEMDDPEVQDLIAEIEDEIDGLCPTMVDGADLSALKAAGSAIGQAMYENKTGK